MKGSSYNQLDLMYKGLHKAISDEEERNRLIEYALGSLQRNLKKYNIRTIENAFPYMAVSDGALLANALSRAALCSIITDANVAMDIINFLDDKFCVSMKNNESVQNAQKNQEALSYKITADLLGYNALTCIELIVQSVWEDSTICGEDKKKIVFRYILPYLKDDSRIRYCML